MDWRVSFVVCLLVALSAANEPLMSPGYAKTSVTGSAGTGVLPHTKFIQMRSAEPDTFGDPNKLQMVPTSFSNNRLPLLRNPEPVAAPPQEVPTGRALQEPGFLSSAIARSFQDVLPSEVNSLTSSTSDDIQKSPAVTEYSYGNNGYYEYPQAQDRYHPQHPYQAGYPADYFQQPPTGTVSDIGDVSNSPMGPKPADTYHPAPYSPPTGYPSYSPYPYSYNPPAPPPPPEEPPEEEDDDDDLDKGVYTHYNIGRKLYYAPLWFALYMTGYLFIEICKHVWRHKYTFPVRAEDALGIGRSAGDNATYIEHVSKVVNNAIESNSKKYSKS